MEEEVRSKFDSIIHNQLRTMDEVGILSDVNAECQKFADTVNNTAKQEIGYKKGKRKSEWISKDSVELIEKRKQVKVCNDDDQLTTYAKKGSEV